MKNKFALSVFLIMLISIQSSSAQKADPTNPIYTQLGEAMENQPISFCHYG